MRKKKKSYRVGIEGGRFFEGDGKIYAKDWQSTAMWSIFFNEDAFNVD